MREFRIPAVILTPLVRAVEWYVATRLPDEEITTQGNPYMDRWKLLPINRFFNVFVHRFMRSDDDRALHDHPWDNVSILLKGSYIERLAHGGLQVRRPGSVVVRRAAERHRIVLFRKDGRNEPVWSIFIRFRKFREWGFTCDDGRWFHWRRFLAEEDRSDWNLCETDMPGNVQGEGPDTGPDSTRR